MRKVMSINVSTDLIARAREISDLTPGLTVAELCRIAVRSIIDRLEKLNGGGLYPPRTGRLKPGRPHGSPDKKSPSVPVPIQVNPEIQDRLRNAIFWNPKLRIQSEMERALEEEIRKREKALLEQKKIKKK